MAVNGFREEKCPVCGQWVYVVSLQDDTRWRYTRHEVEAIQCEGSMELVSSVSTREAP